MAVATADIERPKPKHKLLKMESWWGVLWIMPSLIAVMVFVYGFIGWTARVSVSAWKWLLADYCTGRFIIDIEVACTVS